MSEWKRHYKLLQSGQPRFNGPNYWPPLFLGNLGDDATLAGASQLAFGPDGNIYLLAGTNGVVVKVNPIAANGKPAEISRCTSATVLAGVSGIVFDPTGTYAFLSKEVRDGVSTLRLSDMTLVDEELSATILDGASGIDIVNNLLLVSTFNRRGMAFIDATNPLAMGAPSEFRGAVAGTTFTGARRPKLIPGTTTKALMVCDGTGANLSITGIDFTNPAAAVDIPGLDFARVATAPWNAARGIEFDCDYNGVLAKRPFVYIAGSDGANPPLSGGLAVFGINGDASSMQLLFDSAIHQKDRGSFYRMASTRGVKSFKFGTRYYLLQSAEVIGNLTLYDVTNPRQPVIVGWSMGPDARVSADGAMGIDVAWNATHGCFIAAVACFASSAGPTNMRGLATFRLHLPFR